MRHPIADIRSQVLGALCRCGYQARGQAMVPVREQLEAEVQFVTEGMLLLRAGEALGETAVLDAEPRMASVTAVVETQLLRLDQEPLYELMADHSEVSRAIIQVLSRYLRARAQELSELRGRPKNLEA